MSGENPQRPGHVRSWNHHCELYALRNPALESHLLAVARVSQLEEGSRRRSVKLLSKWGLLGRRLALHTAFVEWPNITDRDEDIGRASWRQSPLQMLEKRRLGAHRSDNMDPTSHLTHVCTFVTRRGPGPTSWSTICSCVSSPHQEECCSGRASLGGPVDWYSQRRSRGLGVHRVLSYGYKQGSDDRVLAALRHPETPGNAVWCRLQWLVSICFNDGVSSPNTVH